VTCGDSGGPDLAGLGEVGWQHLLGSHSTGNTANPAVSTAFGAFASLTLGGPFLSPSEFPGLDAAVSSTSFVLVDQNDFQRMPWIYAAATQGVSTAEPWRAA
jgi:hypothetical protein